MDATDSAWIMRALQITENCIDEFVREFLELPYLHRVEHSIHIRLHDILKHQPCFDRYFPIANGILTQLIHKEWPEAIPEKGKRRGNFDLAIHSPYRLKTCNLDTFREGRVLPPIVIEVGLDTVYGTKHLSADAEKLLNSQVQCGYLIHLVREKAHDPKTEKIIESLKKESTIKIAFARVYQGKKFIKLLNHQQIQELD